MYKVYQPDIIKKTKKGLKKLVKGTKIFLKKRKTKRNKMVPNDIKIFVKMKSKGWLSIEKDVVKYKKIKPPHK